MIFKIFRVSNQNKTMNYIYLCKKRCLTHCPRSDLPRARKAKNKTIKANLMTFTTQDRGFIILLFVDVRCLSYLPMKCKHIAHCVPASKFEGCNISVMLSPHYTMLYQAPCAVYSGLYTGWDVQMV